MVSATNTIATSSTEPIISAFAGRFSLRIPSYMTFHESGGFYKSAQLLAYGFAYIIYIYKVVKKVLRHVRKLVFASA